ncbi:MAG: cohesin domain-containing protein [Oscillospiraceae bacterium]|nr:cohesin domain-containing protein [Oscillospiraceae bacterium]MDD7294008.1 cohesin domain-containing protein [Oscillospiraceae bacterium]
MKTKRTMAGILAVAMAASAMAWTPVFAAGEIGVSAEKVSAKIGQEFTLQVSLSDVPASGLGGCEFSLAYDSTIVTVTNVQAGAITETGADEQSSAFAGEAPSFDCNYETAGVIDVIWATGLTDSTYWVKQDGVFLTITGTVNESAKVGDVSEFKIQAIDREVTPGSGTKNDKVTFVSLDANGDVTSYDTVLSDGSVTVIGDDVTTTTTTATTTNKPDVTTTTVTTVSGGEDRIAYGDTNLDGVVDLRDAISMNKYLAGLITWTSDDQAYKNADVNADGSVKEDDGTILVNFVINLISELPQIGA